MTYITFNPCGKHDYRVDTCKRIPDDYGINTNGSIRRTTMTTATATFELNGQTFEASIREDTEYGKRRGAFGNAKVYVWGEGDVDDTELHAVAERVGSMNYDKTGTSIYSSRGDYPELDKAWDRHNREIVRRKRVIFDAAMTALELTPEKATFGRNVGCRCGCSPGFALKGTGMRPVEIFINEVEQPTQADLLAFVGVEG